MSKENISLKKRVAWFISFNRSKLGPDPATQVKLGVFISLNAGLTLKWNLPIIRIKYNGGEGPRMISAAPNKGRKR